MYKVNWTKEFLEQIVLNSKNQKDVLNKLGIKAAGGNFKTLRKYIQLYKISTEHFTNNYDKLLLLNNLSKKDISEYLIENSSCSRANLKRRLFDEKLIENVCCLCGQDENWRGKKIALILDHVNGISNDNRLENLRIVCPNCNAGLDTHCGKNKIKINKKQICKCGNKKSKKSTICIKCNGLEKRKIERPNKKQLVKEINLLGYCATGRKYGVSDNAIRKWIKNSD